MVLKIEITHTETGKRWYVRPGATVGRLESDVNIDNTDLGSVQFRFIIDDSQNCLFEYMNGNPQEVTVDQKSVSPESPTQAVGNGTRLTLGSTEYRLSFIEEIEDVFWGVAYTTITGSVRRHNEDALAIYQRPPIHLFAVADGVGGESEGHRISAYVCKQLIHCFNEMLETSEVWRDFLGENLHFINRHVRAFGEERSKHSEHRQKPGTTLTALIAHSTDLLVVHIGDSRLYRLRDSQLQQLTEDHVLSKPILTPILEERRFQPKQTHLLQAIGRDDNLNPDFISEEAQVGDMYLLCSDGLTDRVEEAELTRLLQTLPFSDLPDYLAHLADIREGRDNISLIILRVTDHFQPLAIPPTIPRVYTGNEPVEQLIDGDPTGKVYKESLFPEKLALRMLFIIPIAVAMIMIILYFRNLLQLP